jgi:catechol 2,3-dioxygenase-like lactoylglutathione lyase family enzyme
MTDTSTAQHIPGVGTVYLPVSDQDRALAFYRDALGFEVRTDTEFGEGFRWIEVAPAGAYTVIALVSPMRDEDPQPGGAAPFGFDTANLEAAMAEFSSRGVEFEDVMKGDGPVPPMAYFRDPEGNRILLVEATAH